VFAIATAFTGNLIHLTSSTVDSGGFHLYGDSSIGKSITLALAASVWGRGGKVDNPQSYIRKWASTSTAIEITASVHNDMCLDPCDHSLYKFGKLHRARQVLSSLLSGNELKHEHP
jgi:uncharacterized protein (DUF927 family)